MTHKKPAKHYTATAFILTDTLPRKILLVHHKKFNNWMPPGGHQEEWENPVEAAIREVHEETGLDITAYIGAVNPIDAGAGFIPRPNYFLECHIKPHGKEPQHYHLDQSYVVRIPEQAATVSHESHDIRWYTIEEIDGLPMFDNVRMIAKQEMSQL
jgi:8-oxo-dGTP pyrophosphatase MutT (NUDIX family)